MSIRNAIRTILDDGVPRAMHQILSELPTFADHIAGEDELLLLLRLDPRFKQVDDGRWIHFGSIVENQQRIIELTQHYLDSLPGSGGVLSSIINHVVAASGYDRQTVEAVITAQFHVKGLAVINKRKVTA